MQKTRCKFRCNSITPTPGAEAEVRVSMGAQYDENLKEDQSFSKYTPSGELTFLVNNPAAIELFSVGQYYYLDIIPVAPVAASVEGAETPNPVE